MWTELIQGIKWTVGIPGIVILAIGLFGENWSPALGRSKRVLVAVGALLVVLSMVPVFAETFTRAFAAGRTRAR